MRILTECLGTFFNAIFSANLKYIISKSLCNRILINEKNKLLIALINHHIRLVDMQLRALRGHSLSTLHYGNMSMQYTAIFHSCKNVNYQVKNCDFFLIFAQNIDCGYTLEPPQYKKKISQNLHFYCHEKSLYIAWTCFRDGKN